MTKDKEEKNTIVCMVLDTGMSTRDNIHAYQTQGELGYSRAFTSIVNYIHC